MTYSSFLLCDLQVHTIQDTHHKYGDFVTRSPSIPFAKRLLESFASKGVNVIAVTDHNSLDWYPLLSELASDYDIHVFPGVELNVSNCHLLLIWDRTDEALQKAREYLPSLWFPEGPTLHDGEYRPVTKGQVAEVAASAASSGALVIAPHSTQKRNGLLSSHVVTNRKELLASGCIAAFDVADSPGNSVLHNPHEEFGSFRPTWVLTSDCRSFEKVGAGAIYLKMSSPPTLEGLRQAFIASESRVRFPSGLQERWKRTKYVKYLESTTISWPYIQSIDISGGFHDSLSVRFAPGLNAIIGGKGTGKSTLIETIRYVLDARQPADPSISQGIKQNFKANADSTIRYADGDGHHYDIHRAGGGARASISRGSEVYDPDLEKRRPHLPTD